MTFPHLIHSTYKAKDAKAATRKTYEYTQIFSVLPFRETRTVVVTVRSKILPSGDVIHTFGATVEPGTKFGPARLQSLMANAIAAVRRLG